MRTWSHTGDHFQMGNSRCCWSGTQCIWSYTSSSTGVDATERMDLGIRVVSKRGIGAILKLIQSSINSNSFSRRGRFTHIWICLNPRLSSLRWSSCHSRRLSELKSHVAGASQGRSESQERNQISIARFTHATNHASSRRPDRYAKKRR